jgi:predicted nucleotide-binding protein (sugar kinase/HSP70/actin superfamily)
MKITFPHLGNTYISAKAMLDDLDVDYVIPPYNNQRGLELGSKYAPEMACLPLKINIGNYIQAYEQGADTIMITGGCGPCRFGYYAEMHREILKDAGFDMDIITLEYPDGGIPELLRRVRKLAGGFNVHKILKTIKNTAQIAKLVDELEMYACKVRASEIEKGDTDRVYKAFKSNIKAVKGSAEIKKLIKDTKSNLDKINTDKSYKPLRVGIVGEIYTTIDDNTNFYMQSKLGSMGVEVDRSVTVSGWIIEHILKNALHLPRDLRYEEAAKPYLGRMIGGHAQETIGNTILYAKNGYDGVIQIYPLSCMPEIVAESILPAVENDYNIPILTLIIDEMTGEAGYMTRIEAFVDLLKKRRERKTIEQKWILSGD